MTGDRIDDGGPAFPHEVGAGAHGREGMSLRDWFAGQALMGLMSSSPGGMLSDREMGAVHAYGLADAMLKARKP